MANSVQRGFLRDANGALVVSGGGVLMTDTYVPGTYYSTPAGATTTVTRPNGTMVLLPFQVQVPYTFTGLAVQIAASGSAGALVRLGVYSQSGGKPSALVLDAGTIDGTQAAGVYTISSLALALSAGTYYLAAVQQGAPTTLTTLRGITTPVAQERQSNNFSTAGVYSQGSVTGALPSTLSSLTVTDTSIIVALVG